MAATTVVRHSGPDLRDRANFVKPKRLAVFFFGRKPFEPALWRQVTDL